jgi:hypothetical protein
VSVLMLVAATGRDQFLDVLLQDPEIRATINDADKHGDTALHHAFQSSVLPLGTPHLARATNLLTAQPPNRTRTRTTAHAVQLQRFFKNAYPVTPVQEAVVYRLVRAGADLNAKNRDKFPPRYFASRHYKALLSSTPPRSRTTRAVRVRCVRCACAVSAVRVVSCRALTRALQV